MENVETITINGLDLKVVFVHLKLIQVIQYVESTIELMKASVLPNVSTLQSQEEDSAKTNVTVITTSNLFVEEMEEHISMLVKPNVKILEFYITLDVESSVQTIVIISVEMLQLN